MIGLKDGGKMKLCLSIIIGLLGVFCATLYCHPFDVHRSPLVSQQPVGEICKGVEVRQEFVATKNKLKKISFLLATFARTNTADLVVSLREKGDSTILASKKFSGLLVKDNAAYDFDFPCQENSRGRSYELSFTSSNGSNGNALTVWTTSSAAEDLDYTVDGSKCEGRHVAVDLYYRDFRIHAVVMVLAIMAMLFVLAVVGVLGLSSGELLFLAIVCVFYSFWTWRPCLWDTNPDELMRLDVTKFLFEHHRLPVGDELLHPFYGFSYAHLPLLACNVAGYWFMCLADLVGVNDPKWLILTARMVSVVCGTAVVYWTIRTAKIIFRSSVRWVMIFLVAALPQFAFLSSYVNNDIVAMLGVSMILYSWIDALARKWNRGNMISLIGGMSICILSYYNSYGWVLLSVIVFPVIYWCRNDHDIFKLSKLSGTIALMTFIASSYFFIRQYYYYGDVLGFATCRHFAESCAKIAACRPYNERGGLVLMLWGDDMWWSMTIRSFIGCFGGMRYYLPEWCFRIYECIGGICACGLCVRIITGHKRLFRRDVAAWTCWGALVSGMIIVIALSVVYSYRTDFQPQGRYCISVLMPLALILTKGFDCLLEKVIDRRVRGCFIFFVCSSVAFVAIWAYHMLLVDLYGFQGLVL